MIEAINKSNSKILHQCDECVEISDHAALKMHGTPSIMKITYAKYLEYNVAQNGRSF
jgi:hypothetical protein